MLPHLHIRIALQVLFGLLLVCWPVLDTAPMGAVTTLRIALGSGMLLLSAATIMTAGFRKQPVKWNLTDWAVLACSVWYAGNVVFIGGGQTDPYNLLNGFVVLTAYLFCCLAGSGVVLPAMLVSGLVQAGIATAQLCGVMATRHSYHDFTGSFPNPGPLGGWLCVAALAAVILTVQFRKQRRKLWAVLCAGGGLYIGIILLLTDSRAAWLGFAAGGFCLFLLRRFYPKYIVLKVRNGPEPAEAQQRCGPPPGVASGRPLTRSSSWKGIVLVLLTGLGIAAAGWLYGYKKDSADGRLLVWRVSADMIAEHPVAGSGIGTFPERYMFAQGNYFERHPDSRFATVAEQTSYPFNELIGVTCEQGIVGGLLFLFLVGSVLVRRGNAGGKTLLIGLSVFGLFSYPSAFLTFGLLFAALLAYGMDGSSFNGRPLSLRKALCGAFVTAVCGISLLLFIHSGSRTDRSRYVRIREASDLMRRNNTANLSRLEELARRLPIAGFYTDLGDLYLENDSTKQAKHYYRVAARMIPSRLKPYDGLFRAYILSGQTDSAAAMARHIVTMPVKVSNTATIRIRQSAKEWLETHNPDL